MIEASFFSLSIVMAALVAAMTIGRL